MDIGVAIGLCGAAAAVFFDLRDGRVPNRLTSLMILLSVPLALLSSDMMPWAANLVSSFILFYLFWEMRVWAGGDSKLLIALAALIPRYPGSAILPAPPYSGVFYLTVVFNLLIIYALYVFSRILSKNRDYKALFLRSPLSFAMVGASLFLASMDVISFLYPLMFSIFYVYSEASKARFTRIVRASDLRVGDNLAERIIETKKGVFAREKEGCASFYSLMRDLLDKSNASPAPSGLSPEQRKRLQVLVEEGMIDDGFEVYDGVKMSPLILSALIVSVFYGDVFAAIIGS